MSQFAHWALGKHGVMSQKRAKQGVGARDGMDPIRHRYGQREMIENIIKIWNYRLNLKIYLKYNSSIGYCQAAKRPGQSLDSGRDSGAWVTNGEDDNSADFINCLIALAQQRWAARRADRANKQINA